MRNLLSMDSGREWSPLTDYLRLLPAPDRTAFAIGLGQDAAPGTSGRTTTRPCRRSTPCWRKRPGRTSSTFAERRLFGPLGMAHTTLGTDRAGNPQLFEGMQSTCRDLARFGLLMLDRGRWGDRQIVSSDWVKRATGSSSTRLNAAYGYLWWLNREGVIPEITTASGCRRPRVRGGVAWCPARRPRCTGRSVSATS